MADTRHPADHDNNAPSVSALGLRWAALRGMLGSPLIEAEEQRGLREELVRELQTIEREFARLQARNAVEVSAKIEVAKTALRDEAPDHPHWIVDLLGSVQSDLRTMAASAPAARPGAHLSRGFPARAEPAPAPAAAGEAGPTE